MTTSLFGKKGLGILAIADLHYVGGAEHVCDVADRHSELGAILVRKALRKAQLEGLQVDLIVILGDVVDDGSALGAMDDLKVLFNEVRKTGLPVLAVCGNHDADPAEFVKATGCPDGIHEIGGFRFIVFNDDVKDSKYVTRPQRYFELLKQCPKDMPIVALQHNPVFPEIQAKYPYMPRNAAEIRKSYVSAGVILSLSGHYHRGIEITSHEGVSYRIVPAACEEPFGFDHILFEGDKIAVTPMELKVGVDGLTDNHLHTQLAYCATSVNIEDDINVSRLMGLKGITITEHAFQLYFPNKAAWSYTWQDDPEMRRLAYAGEFNRMKQYRACVDKYRSDFTHFGLEVDLCADGSLLLDECDMEGWDLLVGAIHSIPEERQETLSQVRAEKLFMRDCERLLANPINILAHPFRWFGRSKLKVPDSLFAPLAEMLAGAGVAAEINYHTNNPDLCFIEECLARNVKLSLATDSHDIVEVGDMHPHLKLLRQAGVADKDILRVLVPSHRHPPLKPLDCSKQQA